MNRTLFQPLFLLTLWAVLLPQDARGQSADTGAKEKARELHAAGKKAYTAGHYLEAAESFAAGYAVDPRPGFLLNIAQSYRKADRPREAIRYYQRYLDTAADTRLASQVKELIEEIQRQLPRDATPPPPEPKHEPNAMLSAETSTSLPPASPSKPLYRQWWFWTGVAAVVVGTALGIGVYAGTREPDYVKEGPLGSLRW